YRDDLSELYNKRFYRNIGKFIQREQIVFSIFDIDDFKYVNDVYGHHTGDRIIGQVGRTVSMILEKSEVGIRFGGDEFIIIFTEGNTQDALGKLEAIRNNIKNNLLGIESRMPDITCSFGVASGALRNIDELMKKADRALYGAKASGKDNITVFRENMKEKRYMPVDIERKVKNEMAGSRNVIVRGGFSSGKTFLIQNLKKNFRNYHYYNLDLHYPGKLKPPFLITINPAVVYKDRMKNLLLKSIYEDFKPAEFRLSNFNKSSVIELFNMYERESTLFSVNFIDLVTSGNPGILKRMFSADSLFDLSPVFNNNISVILSMMDREIIESLNDVHCLGLRFNVKEAQRKGLSEKVEFLTELMLLDKRNNSYSYTYTPVYFNNNLSAADNTGNNYGYIFKTAEKLNNVINNSDRENADLAEFLIDYGDLHYGEYVLKRIPVKSDRIVKLNICLMMEKHSLPEAYDLLESISSDKAREELRLRLDAKSGKDIVIENPLTPIEKLLCLYQAIKHNKKEAIRRILESIDVEELDDSQKNSYYHILCGHMTATHQFEKAMDCLNKASHISRENHFIASYGKILMNKGLIYLAVNRPQRALNYLKRSLNIIRLTGFADSLISVKFNIAVIYTGLGNFNRALQIYSEMLTNEILAANLYYRAIILHNMAEIHLRSRDMEEARRLSMRAEELMDKCGRQMPVSMKIQKSKIAAIVSGEYNKLDKDDNTDIIDRVDIDILELLSRSNEISDSSIIKFFAGLKEKHNYDELPEQFVFAALALKERKKIRHYLLKEALELTGKKSYLRSRQIKKIMEEK
ncbi:MAG: diguanylate cyclase, partial [candidate division WOR-3 bacterium]|nr:diguanylate cyclase [candidate division WOR-3 bacterium]